MTVNELILLLARFTVAGYDDERCAFTEPVAVCCSNCGESSPMLGQFGGPKAKLPDVLTWARDHRCPPAEMTSRRLEAVCA